MPRPKKLSPGDVVEVPKGQTIQQAASYFFTGCVFPDAIKELDETIPSDNAMTNNQVRASIRETRAKLNEIINILNTR